ncbi:MAG: hypothetical protein ACOX6S_09555 [Clostridia bacterium]
MESVCPICNGLFLPKEHCPYCNAEMDEIGKMEDYFGPYSPYMEEDDLLQANHGMAIGDQECVHLFRCIQCNRIKHKPFIPKVI